MKARGRPQSGQRLRVLTLNFGFFPIFTSLQSLAKDPSPLKNYFLNGMPISFKSSRACSLFLAVVQIVTVKPRTASIAS